MLRAEYNFKKALDGPSTKIKNLEIEQEMKNGFFILRNEVINNKDDNFTTETSNSAEYTQIKVINTNLGSTLSGD